MSSNEMFDETAREFLSDVKWARTAERRLALARLRKGLIDGAECSRALSDITDKYTLAVATYFLTPFENDITLFWGGGNARREEAPRSDNDLMVLRPESWGDDVQQWPKGFTGAYEQFYYALDAAGFPNTGAARVCSVAEYEQGATTTKKAFLKDAHKARSNLLELRYLCFNRRNFKDLRSLVEKLNRDPVRYLEDRFQTRQEYLAKPANGSQLLEPNIKDGRGGLRDYQTLHWVANVLEGCRNMDDLVERGFLSWEEVRELEEAHKFQLTVRSHLHAVSKRSSNQLAAEYQVEIARRLREYGTPEALMQRYHQSARTIAFLTDTTCDAISEKVFPDKKIEWAADGDFLVGSGKIKFTGHKKLNARDMLGIFVAAQEKGLKLHHSALRAIHNNLTLIDEVFRDKTEAQKNFIKILTGKNGSDYLRQMQEVGFLQMFDRDFAKIDNLRQFDPNHLYTVCEHTHQTVGSLEKILAGTFTEEEAFITRFVPAINDSESNRRVLFYAAYLHDICKAYETNGDIIHPEMGRDLALRDGKRRGLSEEETEKVAWLVEKHLVLWHMAQGMDPHIPATVDRLLQHVPSIERLNLLATLTAADIMGEGPDKWNWFRNSQIQTLHDNAAARILKQDLKTRKTVSLPEGYQPGETSVTLEAFNGKANVITVATPDHPGLFKNLVGALTSGRNNIMYVEAALHGNNGHGRTIVNRFVFENQSGQIANGSGKSLVEEVRRAALADQRIDYSGKIRGSFFGKSTFPVKTLVSIANDVGEENEGTFVKIEAADRPGLLDSIADVFNDLGLDISFLTVTTQGHRASNTFYLKTPSGGKVRDGDAHKLYQHLMECIAPK